MTHAHQLLASWSWESVPPVGLSEQGLLSIRMTQPEGGGDRVGMSWLVPSPGPLVPLQGHRNWLGLQTEFHRAA